MFSRLETVISLVGNLLRTAPAPLATRRLTPTRRGDRRPETRFPATDVTDAEKLATLSRKVDDRAAKHIALEALFEHLTVPVYLAVIPQLALELVSGARTLEVKLPDGPQKFRVEEHINSLVDRLERRIRRRRVSLTSSR
jgi:hypothetical protein